MRWYFSVGSLFCIFCMCSLSFSMKKPKKEVEGERIYNNMLAYIKSAEREEQKQKLIKIVSSNLVEFGLHKSENSMDEISEELKDIPFMGSLLKIPGFSYFTNKFVSTVASHFVNFKAAKKEKSKLKEHMVSILQKSVLEKSQLVKTNFEKYRWVQKEIKPFKPIEIVDRKMLFQMLCTCVVIVRNNKTMFKTFLTIGKVRPNLQDFFYNQLVLSEDIEAKIRKTCFRGVTSDDEYCDQDFGGVPMVQDSNLSNEEE